MAWLWAPLAIADQWQQRKMSVSDGMPPQETARRFEFSTFRAPGNLVRAGLFAHSCPAYSDHNDHATKMRRFRHDLVRAGHICPQSRLVQDLALTLACPPRFRVTEARR